MARQPIEKLQGLSQTSSPSASPIDTYTGAPSTPRVTPATQLADALGTMSSAVARAGEREKAEREAQAEIKAKGYAASFKGEEGEFLDSVKLGETYADLSTTVTATIVEDKYRNKYYQSTFEKLNNLDDDVKGDVVALENLFESIIAETNEATTGMDFVNSGAVQGARNAINEMRREFSEFRDVKTRELAKVNTEANVYNILGKYDLSTNDGKVSAVALVNDLNEKLIQSSPFTKTEDKQQIVDALISYNKLNPESNAVSLIDSIPWLKSKETDAKLAKAGPVISQLSLQQLQDKAQEKKLLMQKDLDESQKRFNQLSLEGKRDEIRQAMANSFKLEDPAMANAVYKQGEIALASADVPVEDSLAFAAKLESDLVALAIKGELSREDALAQIYSSTEIRVNEKNELEGKLDTIMSGNKLIASATHSSEFNIRVGDEARLIDKSLFALEANFDGRSLEAAVRDVWDESVYGLIQSYADTEGVQPEGVALRKIYDDAEDIAERYMNKMKAAATEGGSPLDAQADPIQTQYVEGEVYPNEADGNNYRYLGGPTTNRDSWELVEEDGLTEEEMNAEAPEQYTMEDAERVVEQMGLNIDPKLMIEALEILNNR